MSDASPIGSPVVMVVVLCTAAMVGCLDGSDTSPEAGDAAGSVPTALALDGCREILGSWELTYEDVQPYLPPGFEPFGGGFSEPATGANVTMDVLAFSCTEPEEAAVLIPWLYAEPPDHLLDAETEAYRLALPCIGDAAIAERLQAWGIACITAEAGMTVEMETPTAAQWAFQAETADLTVRLEGQGAESGEVSVEPVFGQFHAVDGELCAFTQVRLENHVHWRGRGFNLEVDGEAPFPVPDAPGSGLLALPDIPMNVTPVAIAADSGSKTSACPPGQMPPGSQVLPTAQEPWNRTSVETLSDGSPIPAGFDLNGCEEQGGTFAADPGAAGDLPEGFSHVSSDPAAATATLHWIGRSCELEGDASYAEIWGLWQVRPPEHLARDGADSHLLAYSVASSDEHQVDVYEAWGMEDQVIPARISIEVLQEGPSSRTGHVSGEAGGSTLNVYTSMRGEAAPAPARTARVFGYAGGELTGAMDLSWTATDNALLDGEATWTVDTPPPPPESGLGFQRWGAGYDVSVDRVDLGELGSP